MTGDGAITKHLNNNIIIAVEKRTELVNNGIKNATKANWINQDIFDAKFLAEN